MAGEARTSRRTVEGKYFREAVGFIALFVAIALAGFNSGNNLLYLISGIMLAGIVVSLAAGYANLFRIRVSRRLPAHVFAGQSFKIFVEIQNRKKHFSSYGLQIMGAGSGERILFVPFVGRKGKQAREVEASLSRRGLHEFRGIVVASRFPWGLFDMKKKSDDSHEIIVYPPVYEMERVITGSSRIRDEFPQLSKGPGSGLYGVREYRHGEDMANISWKLSAKLDKLIVRETEAEEKRRVCVAFDETVLDSSKASLDAFERAVSAAASLVWYLSRNGYIVKLVTRDKIIGYGSGPEQMHKMLIVLALIQPNRSDHDGFSFDKRLLEGGSGILVRCAHGPAVSSPRRKDFELIISEQSR